MSKFEYFACGHIFYVPQHYKIITGRFRTFEVELASRGRLSPMKVLDLEGQTPVIPSTETKFRTNQTPFSLRVVSMNPSSNNNK